jgi:hypothetical protein
MAEAVWPTEKEGDRERERERERERDREKRTEKSQHHCANQKRK